MSLAAAAAVTAGCNGPFVEGTIPEQLEALSVEAGSAQTSGAIGASGVLHVASSGERAFSLEVGEGATAVMLEVHSPGNSPLQLLDQEQVTVAATEPGEGGRSLVVSDAEGPLYVAALGDTYGLANVAKVVGKKPFARFGEEVAREGDGTFIWSYTKGVFATDEGDVALLPGEVRVIRVDGVSWRAVLNVAYEVSTDPTAPALPGCSPDSMLGYELQRVAEPKDIVLDRVVRVSDRGAAFVGCTAPGGTLEE
ncbi:MAG: hypothetical protein U0414_02320 [Polyangiaceae bacterium]